MKENKIYTAFIMELIVPFFNVSDKLTLQGRLIIVTISKHLTYVPRKYFFKIFWKILKKCFLGTTYIVMQLTGSNLLSHSETHRQWNSIVYYPNNVTIYYLNMLSILLCM